MKSNSIISPESVSYFAVDWDRVTTGVRNELKCGICTNCVIEGTECGSCRQLFCTSCCEQQQLSLQCPTCLKGDNFDPHNHRLSAQAEIMQTEVKVSCKFQPLGCEVVVSLREVLHHEENVCPFRNKITECSGCKGTFKAEEYLDHENSCDLLEMQCKICHMTLPKKLKKDHTRVVCVFQKMKAAENAAIRELMSMKTHLNKIMSRAKMLNNHMMVECKSCSKYCGGNENTKCANCKDQYCIRCSKNSKSCQNPSCGLFYCKSCGVDKLYSNRRCRICNANDAADKRFGYMGHPMGALH